jgi:acetyl-CoA acetyltransferase
MKPSDLRGKVAIVGASEADEIGIVPGKALISLMAEGVLNALADAGLSKKDVDGIFCAGTGFSPSAQLGEYLGIVPKYTDGTGIGGCSFIALVEHAALALNAGIIDCAVIAHGESGRSGVGRYVVPIPGDSVLGQFEMPYGTFGPTTTFSLPAVRHMHQYGTKREHFAEVAVATRKWAKMHPKALMKDPLTIDDVMSARLVCWPLTLPMCCLVTDAGGAIVLTRADRAKDLKKPPVYVLGTGQATEHAMVSMMGDMTSSASARVAGRNAFAMAGLAPKDIQVAELYDAFAFTPMFALEDLGFCKPGESGDFVSKQRTAPGGAFPMNTNGGGLSYTHSGMYGMYTLIELTRQLRGECGERQVQGAKTGIAHGPGGMFSGAATMIATSEQP